MRYQLVPENQKEEQALAAYPAAHVLFGAFVPLLQIRALMAAVRLGVFAVIGDGESDPASIASEVGLQRDVLEPMLRVLVNAGLLIHSEHRYRLSKLAAATVSAESPSSLVGWLTHNYVHWDTVAALEETLKTGCGRDAHEVMKSAEEWRAYQCAMLETARPVAPRVAELVQVPAGARAMLDIGGSHGLYGAMICRRHPPLKSVVLELPAALSAARALAQAEGLSDVVRYQAGNVLTDDLGEAKYDLVFLGNVIHHFSPEVCQGLLKSIRRTLRAEGRLVIWDFWESEEQAPHDLIRDAFALLFRIASHGECHRMRDLHSWLSSAGFSDIGQQRGEGSAHGLITADPR